ncbi:MAG: CRTAC1 family protein [Cyanobacteria bacterium J06627_32]
MCYVCNAYSSLLTGSEASEAQSAEAASLLAPSFEMMAADIESSRLSTSELSTSELSTTEPSTTGSESAATPQAALQQVIETTVENIQALLSEFGAAFGSEPAEYLSTMQQVFGADFSEAAALRLRKAWAEGDFSAVPKIEILSDAELDGARAAYEADTATIYVSAEFLDLYQNHAPTLIALIAEEVGHHVDSLLNGKRDTAGDEGALFAALLQGEVLSEQARQEIQSENDLAVITLADRSAQIEQNRGSAISFVDVTRRAGDFIAGRSYGAGAWGDFNGDGLPDLWVNNHFGPSENLFNRNLFINNGDGTFTDAVAEVLAGQSDIFLPDELQGDFHGSAWADFDNDGDQDLIQLVGGEGNTTTLGKENLPPDSEPNRLYVNEGGVLRDRTADYGLRYDSAKAQAAIWLDYNNDGRLDLFHGSTQRTDGLNPTTVFRQTQNGFRNVGATVLPSGLQGESVKLGGLANFTDSDEPSLIFPGAIATILDTTTTPFSDTTNTSVDASSLLKGTRDFAIADFNNDLLMDAYLTRGQDDRLLLNTPQGLVDASANAGINAVNNDQGEGVVAADFDNDMDVDIYVVRGTNGSRNLSNILYDNQGDGTFVAVANSGGAVSTNVGIGDNVTTADYDVDGFIDLFVTNGTATATNGPQQLFRNRGNSHNWLQLDLEGVTSNRDGVGAQVYVTAGGVTQRRDQTGGVHSNSQNHQRLHFGLAENTRVDLIEVHWPSGAVQRIEAVGVNQVLTITESDTGPGPDPGPDPDPDPDPGPDPNPTGEDYLLSFGRMVSLDSGETVRNEDLVLFDGDNFSLFFDGSDVGLGTSKTKITAFDAISDTEFLMSFNQAISLPGAGTVDDSDVVKFTASSLGSNTAGSFERYLDGSDVGLSTNGENIDALTGLPDGSLLISTQGRAKVTGVNAQDEDVLLFSPTSLGSNTRGTWSLYIDGSDVGLANSASEDIDALAFNQNNQLLLSTAGNFKVAGLSGADEDVAAFNIGSTGPQTSGSFDSPLIFDGSTFDLGSTDVSGIDYF